MVAGTAILRHAAGKAVGKRKHPLHRVVLPSLAAFLLQFHLKSLIHTGREVLACQLGKLAGEFARTGVLNGETHF